MRPTLSNTSLFALGFVSMALVASPATAELPTSPLALKIKNAGGTTDAKPIRIAKAKTKSSGNTKARSRKRRVSTSDRINRGRIGVITGGIGGTYIRMATDIASVLNDGKTMRILPIVGEGSVQNIADILYLEGVDVGIVPSDVLAYIKANGLHRNIDDRIQYVTKLYNEELHLVGGREIKSIKDLEGKTVNFGLQGSGAFITAKTVFRRLGVRVRAVNLDQATAIEKLRNGDVAATVLVAGKPAKLVSKLKASFGLRLIPVPYSQKLQSGYLPTRFSAKDYPDLVPQGETVNSVAVGAVMAVFNWRKDRRRRERIGRFVEAFFSRIDEFRAAPRHENWKRTDLAAPLPGWKRFRAAEKWLEKNQPDKNENLKLSFGAFLDQTSSEEKDVLSGKVRNDLFKTFIEWQKKSRP